MRHEEEVRRGREDGVNELGSNASRHDPQGCHPQNRNPKAKLITNAQPTGMSCVCVCLCVCVCVDPGPAHLELLSETAIRSSAGLLLSPLTSGCTKCTPRDDLWARGSIP